MKRAFTLIELMITVAVLGIIAALFGQIIHPLSARSADVVLRERARQVVEYEADAVIHGKEPDTSVRRALLADLPESHVFTSQRGPLTVVSVSWKSPSAGAEYLELAVLGRSR